MLEKYQLPILMLELAVIIALIIRICRNEAVDWDEAYTWHMVTKNNLSQMLQATAADVHPPLYYLLVMAAISIFGKNIFVVKLVSVAGAVAIGLLGITLVRKRWGVKTAIPFLMVVGLGSQMIYYNVNIRMYSWMTFFVMAALLSAYEIIQTEKIRWWAAFTLASLGGVYTQYFAAVPLAAVYLFLLIWFMINNRRQMSRWFGCSVLTVAGYLPWLGVVIHTLERDASGGRDETGRGEGLYGLCVWAFKNNIKFSEYIPIVLFVAALICLIAGYRKYTKAERAYLFFLGALFWVSYVVCIILTSRMNHFWHNRYLVDTLPVVWLFMLIIIARKNPVSWCCNVVCIAVLVLSSYTIVQAAELNTIPWTWQARQLLEPVQEETKIVYTYDTYDILYEYYMPNAEFVWYEDVDFSQWDGELYVIAWGGADFPYQLYKEGILHKEVMGQMRLEEGVAGVELWRITF